MVGRRWVGVVGAFAVGLAAAEACNSSSTSCPSQTSCNGVCVDTRNDPSNCGQCGTACNATSLCSQGTCTALCTNGQQACAVGDGGLCTNLQSDNEHCGSCTTPCAPLQECSAGTCHGGCPPGQMGCAPDAGAPFCANTKTDNLNCGACAVFCGPEEACVAGACTSSCLAGQTLCGADAGVDAGQYYCASTSTDNANCGTCGHACDPLQLCAAGNCQDTCLSTQVECYPDAGTSIDGGPAQPYCADVKNDNDNCGMCGNVCPSNQPLCSGGICVSLG